MPPAESSAQRPSSVKTYSWFSDPDIAISSRETVYADVMARMGVAEAERFREWSLSNEQIRTFTPGERRKGPPDHRGHWPLMLMEDIRGARNRIVVCAHLFTDRDLGMALLSADAPTKLVIHQTEFVNQVPSGALRMFDEMGPALVPDAREQVERFGIGPVRRIPFPVLRRASKEDMTREHIRLPGPVLANLMHNKWIEIDGRIVWTGSANFTYRSRTNHENMVRIEDAAVGAEYERQGDRLIEQALSLHPLVWSTCLWAATVKLFIDGKLDSTTTLEGAVNPAVRYASAFGRRGILENGWSYAEAVTAVQRLAIERTLPRVDIAHDLKAALTEPRDDEADPIAGHLRRARLKGPVQQAERVRRRFSRQNAWLHPEAMQMALNLWEESG